ncbi:MAG: hypothetical protein V8R51_02540 [Clostridia bacterium]
MTYETIKNRELQTIETNTFADLGPGETKTSTIYASTTLANQEDNSIYDNHVEIIGINSKIARTIKKVKIIQEHKRIKNINQVIIYQL